MELVRKNLVMTFGTEEGKTLNLTISKPKDTLTGADVKKAMDAIVTTGAFGEASRASTVGSAKYVIQQQEVVEF
ncbi:MAG: DUF2922 domain-containing protein [Cellulosilyticaceae bacterium]